MFETLTIPNPGENSYVFKVAIKSLKEHFEPQNVSVTVCATSEKKLKNHEKQQVNFYQVTTASK